LKVVESCKSSKSSQHLLNVSSQMAKNRA